MPSSSRRCKPSSGTRRSIIPTGCGSRSSTATACSRSSMTARCVSRRGLDLRRTFPRLVEDLASRPDRPWSLDGEIVAFDESGKPSLQGDAEPRPLKVEPTSGRQRSRCSLLRPPHFAGIDLRSYVRRPAALPRSACCRRRWCSWCMPWRWRRAAPGGARGRLRRRDRQAQGQPLRSRASARALAQGEVAPSGVRGRRVHEGQGPACAARRAPGRLLGAGRQARYASHVGSGFDDNHSRRAGAGWRP